MAHSRLASYPAACWENHFLRWEGSEPSHRAPANPLSTGELGPFFFAMECSPAQQVGVARSFSTYEESVDSARVARRFVMPRTRPGGVSFSEVVVALRGEVWRIPSDQMAHVKCGSKRLGQVWSVDKIEDCVYLISLSSSCSKRGNLHGLLVVGPRDALRLNCAMQGCDTTSHTTSNTISSTLHVKLY